MVKRRRTKRIGPPGPRYGRTIRKKLAEIQYERKRKHSCHNCESKSVKYTSVGIWKCSRCGITFTGGAYTPYTEIGEIARRNVRRRAQ